MSVKRYTAYDALMQVESNGKFVLASDYDRDTQALRDDYNEACADAMQVAGKLQAVEAERDALRAQVEAMRSALCKFTSLGIVSCNWDEMDDALRHANAALQVEP